MRRAPPRVPDQLAPLGVEPPDSTAFDLTASYWCFCEGGPTDSVDRAHLAEDLRFDKDCAPGCVCGR